jgi:hypothetical protein
MARRRVTRLVATSAFLASLFACMAGFWSRTGLLRRDATVDFVTASEAALAPLREILAGEREVGYLSPEQNGAPFESRNLWGFATDQGRIDFFLTQYSLAPVVVLNDRTVPLLVTPFIERTGSPPGYRQVRGVTAGPEILRRTPGQ